MFCEVLDLGSSSLCNFQYCVSLIFSVLLGSTHTLSVREAKFYIDKGRESYNVVYLKQYVAD
jgi:membrane protein CcdC involved in cytochrome C biogenesis